MKDVEKLVFAFILFFACNSMLNAQDQISEQERERLLRPYPEAAEGMVRYVLFLEPLQDESIYKIELIPGKIMNVDCNQHLLSGRIEEKIIDGWGYPYFEFTTSGLVRSTRMACFKPNEDRFVQAESLIIRYNSRLPVVVYLPEGYTVLHRIWSAGEMQPFPSN